MTKRTADGLSGRTRLAIEFGVAFVATWLIMQVETPPLSGMLAVPFIKTALLPLGLLFILVGGFVVTGAANAVNFTDGLDGLAIVPVMIAAATFTLIVYLVGNEKFSAYLQIPYVDGARRTGRYSWQRWSVAALGLPLVQCAARRDLHGRYRLAAFGRCARRGGGGRQA